MHIIMRVWCLGVRLRACTHDPILLRVCKCSVRDDVFARDSADGPDAINTVRTVLSW